MSYKIEISGKVIKFEQSGEYDGVLLWEFIWRRVNPTTTVGASNFKAEIDRATLADHENSVVTFNIQFDDTRTKIIKEEREGYNEYLRQLFRAYLTCDDSEFNESVRHEKRLWM